MSEGVGVTTVRGGGKWIRSHLNTQLAQPARDLAPPLPPPTASYYYAHLHTACPYPLPRSTSISHVEAALATHPPALSASPPARCTPTNPLRATRRPEPETEKDWRETFSPAGSEELVESESSIDQEQRRARRLLTTPPSLTPTILQPTVAPSQRTC